jgi:iron complex outermembrane receptor protein
MAGFFRLRRLVLIRLCYLGLVVLAVPPCGGSAQDRAGEDPADSSSHRPSHSYILDEVVIRAGRIPSTILRSPAVVSLISRPDIERSGAKQLADVLMTGPGVFVKDYGGPAGLKTISQRGLGTEHTLILVNGMPVTSMQNGLLDLGIIPAGELERVELVRGGQSASFGANAVAGVVNLITRSRDPESVTAQFSSGSFGTREVSAGAGAGDDDKSWRVAGGIQHSDGDYPYIFENGPATYHVTRGNAGYDARRASADLVLAPSGTLRLHTTALYLESERGVPGIVTSPFSESSADQRDQQGILQVGLTHTATARTWWECKLQGVYTYQRYADPGIVVNGVAVNNNFRSLEGRGEAELHTEIPSIGRVTVGCDGVRADGAGNTLAVSPLRLEAGAFLLAEHTFAVTGDSAVLVSVDPAIRYDHVRNIADAISPQLGLQILLATGDDPSEGALVRMHGTIGRNFRTPTFNELYYAGGGGVGNPHLSPEYATTVDAGAGISAHALGIQQIDATFFRADMSDRIVWVSAGAGSVTPRNLRRVVSTGVEVAYSWMMPAAGTTLSGSYSRMRSEKRSADFPGDPNINTVLPYVPGELFSCSAAWGTDLPWGPVTRCDMSGSVMRVGYRYTTEDNTSFLPSYTVLQAGLALEFSRWEMRAVLRADVRNLLNTSYEVMLGYPMPGRSYEVSVAISY